MYAALLKRPIVLTHANATLHPSGCSEPSRADEMLTQTLKQALALVDIRLVDHLVVSAGGATSLAERGTL
jgi:DNA repair protein RadC